MQQPPALVRAGVPAPGVSIAREVLVVRVHRHLRLLRPCDQRARDPAAVAAGQLRRQEAGQVRRGGDHAACRVHRRIGLGQRQRPLRCGGPERVRPRQRPSGTLRMVHRGTGVVHAERLEDARLQLLLPGCGRAPVQPGAEQVVADIGVAERAMGRLRIGMRPRDQRLSRCGVVHAAERCCPGQVRVVHAGGVEQQLARAHRIRVDAVEGDVREHRPQRRLQVEPTIRLGQQRVQREHRLGRRGDVEHRVARHRHLRIDVGMAGVGFVDDATIAEDDDRQPGRVAGRTAGVLDQAIECGEIRCGHGGDRARRCQRQGRQGGRQQGHEGLSGEGGVAAAVDGAASRTGGRRCALRRWVHFRRRSSR